MSDAATLLGLLRAYADGDLLAKRGLLDFLDEIGDSRRNAVQREAIDWSAVAQRICHGDLPRYRYYVDCARFGAGGMPEVVEAVREARQQWLQGLFPEVDLSTP